MKSKAKSGSKVLWGLLYAGTFAAAFVLSAIFKMTYDPLRTRVEWNDEVGTVYTDLSYGQGSANKFDLYVPTDNTKGTYGLVVYLHAGGFTAGDKSGDAEILKWFCARGYVAAGVNYTLFGEENPQASIYTYTVPGNPEQHPRHPGGSGAAGLSVGPDGHSRRFCGRLPRLDLCLPGRAVIPHSREDGL